MIITLDGPAGAGKSTVARGLARRLGFTFLDTGAMYRAVTLAALRRGLEWDDHAALAQLIDRIRIELDDDRVRLDGDDVTDAIRTAEVTALVRHAAGNVDVRAKLVALQRALAADRNVVAEGRDQGTVAFPHAALKIFLTASPEERARRRLEEMTARGEATSLAQLIADQRDRDARDAARSVGPLAAAADAVHVSTDGLSVEQVIDKLEALARERMP